MSSTNEDNVKRVYCAGPLFNAAERREMEDIAQALATAGYEPFVPHADGMEFAEVQPWLVEQGFEPSWAGALLHEAIFALDVYQVVARCGSLVINLNGRVPDEGAVAESTMAWMMGKPVVAYKSDARSAIAGRDNPLVVGPLRFTTVRRIDEIPAALGERIASCSSLAVSCSVPSHLADVVSRGERLWQAVERLPMPRPSKDVAAAVLEIFGAGRTQAPLRATGPVGR